MPALKADVSVQAQMVLMASQLEASERAHSAGSVATEGLSLSRLLELPVGICGPLDVVQLKGKGRGVLAVQPLLPGQLLLATPPLAIVQACNAASDVELPPPTAGDLVQLLAASRLTPRQSQLLAALYSGEDDSNSGSSDAKCESGESRSAGGSRGDSGPRQMRVQQLLQLSAAADGLRLQWGAGSGAAASTGWRTAAQLALPATVRGLRLPDGRVQVLAPTNGSSLAADGGGSRQQERRRSVTGAVVCNCYGEPARDEALEQLLARRRGAAGGGGGHGDGGGGVDAGGGFVGLWADYAMLNHSCCPNTINWVGGPHDHMAVIATAPIAAGQEVSVCYLGRELLAPRSVRTAALQRSHNFTCACRRCEHERRLGSALEAALQHVYDSVNVEWGPRLGALAEEVQDAAEALRELRRQQAQAQALTGQGRQGQASRGLFGALFGAVGGGGVVAAAATMREPVERARAALSSLSNELAALDQQVAATLSDVEMAASQAAAGNAAAATTAAEAGWWVRASLYDAYELRASIAEVLADTARAAASTTASAPGDTAGAVQQAHAALVVAITACLQIVAAVAPGSSLHVRLACQLASQQESQQHHQQQHHPALVEAIAARYGGSVGCGTSRRGQQWQTAAVAGGSRTPGALGVDDMACMVAHAARSRHAN